MSLRRHFVFFKIRYYIWKYFKINLAKGELVEL